LDSRSAEQCTWRHIVAQSARPSAAIEHAIAENAALDVAPAGGADCDDLVRRETFHAQEPTGPIRFETVVFVDCRVRKDARSRVFEAFSASQVGLYRIDKNQNPTQARRLAAPLDELSHHRVSRGEIDARPDALRVWQRLFDELFRVARQAGHV